MFMKRKQRKWTKHEKEKIIHEVQRMGVVSGCRMHQIPPRTYYNWLDRYSSGGIEALEDKRGRDQHAELRRLRKEVRVLKELLAEKELESRFKDELLKKKRPLWGS